jgi:hypothetical protein
VDAAPFRRAGQSASGIPLPSTTTAVAGVSGLGMRVTAGTMSETSAMNPMTV